jgi:transmembrane sensor
MASKERFNYLFEQYFERAASVEERDELLASIDSNEHDEQLKQLIEATWDNAPTLPEQSETSADRIFNYIVEHKKEQATVRRMQPWKRIAVAASLIGVLVMGYWLYNNRESGVGSGQVTARITNDVAPGGNKAVLTLSNGKTVVLDDAKNGVVAEDGNSKVSKTNDGQLAYTALNGKPTEVLYNTLTTPRGGQYQLTLPDGSNVWLNSASSIKYPTAFTGGTRDVEITGEAYFEVAKNAAMPFNVKSNGQVVQVLGTHFNVNTYSNEDSIKTTLLEGSVIVRAEGGNRKSEVLKPGQQAILKHDAIQIVNDADTEEALAWKNGLMVFHSADAATILREIERWYNVDVVIKGELPKRSFFLEGSRKAKLSELLRGFEVNHIKFTIDGEKRKLTVYP